MNRRQTIIGGGAFFGAGALAFLPRTVKAQSANQPVKIVFPFAPGGGGDALCRLLAERISPGLDRAVIIENKTGADGRIGIQYVKAAAPDGGTVLITTGPTMSIMHQVAKAPGFDPFADFAPVAHLATFEFCIIVTNSVPAKSLPELVDWLRANPQKATYGIPSLGTIPHFTGIQLGKLAKLDLTRLPYRGGAQAVQDVIAGQIPFAVVTVADALEQYRGGLLKILATTGTERSPFAPEVATAREAGIELVGSGWYGAWVPARTPEPVIAKLGGLMVAALKTSDMKERCLKLGLIATGLPAVELAALQKDDAERWAPIIKESGFKLD